MDTLTMQTKIDKAREILMDAAVLFTDLKELNREAVAAGRGFTKQTEGEGWALWGDGTDCWAVVHGVGVFQVLD